MAARILIDVGDGTLIVPPPAQPPPAVPPAPAPPESAPAPPAPAPAAPAAPRPILQPGIAYVDLGDVLGPSVLIPAPPVVPAAGGGAGGGGDTGEPVEGTGGFLPNEGDWPDPEAGDAGFTDDDLLGLEEEADAFLSGGIMLAALTHPAPGTIIGTPYAGTHAKAFNIEGGSDNWQSENAVDIWLYPGTHLLACEAGAISPGGWGYGQSASGGRFAGARLHIVTTTGRVFYYTHCVKLIAAKGQKVKKGDLIALSGVANGVPHLHFAVTPPNQPQAWAKATYNESARTPIGKVAPLPTAPVPVSPSKPAGAVAQWRELVDVFKDDVPKQHGRVQSLASSLVEVFK